MHRDEAGFDALRRALAEVLRDPVRSRTALTAAHPRASYAGGLPAGWLQAHVADPPQTDPGRPGEDRGGSRGASGGGADGDHDLAVSSDPDEGEQRRLIALVELARGGDKEAFGALYDHYQPSVYRFVHYRVGAVALAEDLTAETFFRALRGMNGFRWQGRDFGAWLVTIARNLVADHAKASRTRLERSTDDTGTLDSAVEGPDGPEEIVLASLTNATLLAALRRLPDDQQDCLVMRFLQGLSLAETATAMERSSGAVKQLQLRAVRALAAQLPEGMR